MTAHRGKTYTYFPQSLKTKRKEILTKSINRNALHPPEIGSLVAWLLNLRISQFDGRLGLLKRARQQELARKTIDT